MEVRWNHAARCDTRIETKFSGGHHRHRCASAADTTPEATGGTAEEGGREPLLQSDVKNISHPSPPAHTVSVTYCCVTFVRLAGQASWMPLRAAAVV